MLILVVEDEPLVAFAMEWTLKIAGHHILGPADTVDQAIQLCNRRRPDIALIDLNLRDGGDGVEVARYLQEHHETPTLFLSAQVTHARAHRHLACGLVRKPYDSSLLPRIVEFVEAVERGRMPSQPPPGMEVFDTSQDQPPADPPH
jgi:DNA-binding response OmpR family regulator